MTARQFILSGFSEELGFRVFAFEGVAADRSRAAFTVRADLALTRRYGIRLQELPLLCRALLEQRYEDGDSSIAFTEDEMRLHADRAIARGQAAKFKKPPRRPAVETPGGWRSPQQ